MNRINWLLALAASLSLAACGAARDTDTSQPLTINPVGGATGALVVNVPTGLTAPTLGANTLVVYKASDAAHASLPVQWGTPIQLDPNATYCLQWNTLSDCSIKVNTETTTTYTLAGLRIFFDADDGQGDRVRLAQQPDGQDRYPGRRCPRGLPPPMPRAMSIH